MKTLFLFESQKTIDRMTVSTTRQSEWVQLVQTHRNGGIEIVGSITLDNMSALKDLHYALGQIIDSVS